jgi:hypothetical protein
LFDIGHRYPLVIIFMGGQRPRAASLGIHVTSHLRYRSGSSLYQRSPAADPAR